MKKTSALLIAAVLLPALRPTLVTADEWTGNGSSINWSDAGNWESSSKPDSGVFVYFSDMFYPNAYTNAVGAVNNIVDENHAAGGAFFNAQSTATFSGPTSHFYTTLIPGGVTLTLGGLGASYPALSVGDVYGSGQWLATGTSSNYTTFTGPGSLLVNDAASRMSVGQRNRATLDLTGLNTFSVNVQQLLIAASQDNPNTTGPLGSLLLGKTNTITTSANLLAPGIILASLNGANTSGLLALGGTNIINTDGLVVGARRTGSGGGNLSFGTAFSNGSLILRGSSGGNSRVDTFSIGDMAAQPADYLGSPLGFGSQGLADFSGGTVDIRAEKIYVGRSAADTGTGGSSASGFGTLTVERGTVDVNNLYIAYKQGTNQSSAQSGGNQPCPVTIKSNAVLIVNQDVTMAFRNNSAFGSQIPIGSLIVNDVAAVNIGGNVTTPTNGVSILQLGGGTVNMTGGGNLTNTTLRGFGSINGANTITVLSNILAGGQFSPATLNLGGNLVLATPFPVTFDVGATDTPGSGVSDYLNVTGNVSFNNNPILINYNGTLLPGKSYTLIAYSGSKSGSLTFSNDTRSALGLDQATAGQVNLVVTNWNPATLTWQGTSVTNVSIWNTSDLNWTNNAGGAADKFYQGDAVVINDTAITNTIYPNGLLMPSSITVDSSKTVEFTNRISAQVTAVGTIAGNCSITKNGIGTFTFGVYTNVAVGPINVNNGVWKIRNVSGANHASILGNNSATMYVNSGATFDFNGTSTFPSTGKPLVIVGNGFNGQGVLTNSSTTQVLVGYLLTLAGDSMISPETGPFGLRSAVATDAPPAFSGYLNLNGYTLTKYGTKRFTLQDVVATNAGSINVATGYLSVVNSIISGPGAITFSNNCFLLFGNEQGQGTLSTSGAVDKTLNFYNAAVATLATPATAVVNSTVNLLGALSVTNLQPLAMNGVIGGGFGITKYGSSSLMLNAANTYSGQTLITAGTLSLGASGSANNTPLITVNSGAAFDTTAKAGAFALPVGQTLNMNGTVVGDLAVAAGSTLLGNGIFNGSLTVNPGAEVALATTNVPGITIISNNLNLAGGHLTWELAPSSELADGLVVNGNLNLSGVNTFTVNSIGGFDPSGTNTLITYSGTLAGGLPNLAVNTSARFVVEFVDPATTPGKIQIRLVTPSPLLTWKGMNVSNPRNWDIKTTANWDNSGAPDVFWQSDVVRFDDMAITNVVNLVSTLGPASISMENSTLSYTFGGPGGLVAASLTNTSGNLTLTNAGNNFFTGDGLILNGGSITFAQPVNASLTANLSGGGSFNKAAASTLTLTGNSANFGGNFNINAGTLRAGNSNVLGIGQAVVASGATLDINGQFMTAQSSLSVIGVGADGFGAVNNRSFTGRTNAVSTLRLAGDTTLGAISNAWGINGTLVGDGYALTKTNAHDVWIQTGSDTDLGDIDIRQGRLIFGRNGTTLGQSEKSIVIRSAGTLALAATNQMPQSGPGVPGITAGSKAVTMQSGATFEGIGFGANAATVNSFDGSISIVTNASFKAGQNSTLVLNGPVSGNGNIILTNNGQLMLNGTNTYASNTIVYSGTLILTNASALPTNTILAVSNLSSSFGNAGVTFGGDVVFPGSAVMRISSQNGIVTLGGSGTWNGPIFMQGANTFNINGGMTLLDLTGPLITTNVSGGTIAFHYWNTRVRGALNIPGTAVSIGVGDGLARGFDEQFTTVTFDSSNRWASTTIDRGRVNLGTNNAIPVTSAIKVGTLSAGVSDRRIIFDLAGYNQVISNINETAIGDSLVLIGNSSTNSDSLLTVTSAITNTWAIRIVDQLDSPATPHKTALAVTSGTLNLIATNTYTGPTTITGGRLNLIQGSGVTSGHVGQLGGSPVSVSGAGILGGNGLVQDVINVGAGGTLSPGVSIGTLTATSALNLGAGSKCEFEVNLSTGANDQIVGLSSVTYGGTLIITNIGAQPFTNGTVLQLFSAASYNAGAVTIQPSSPGAGLMWDASSLAVNGTLKVVPAVALTVAGTARLPDGNISFNLSGITGQGYSVRASTNVALPLANWTLLSSGSLPSGVLLFTDLTATNYPARFYRASTP